MAKGEHLTRKPWKSLKSFTDIKYNQYQINHSNGHINWSWLYNNYAPSLTRSQNVNSIKSETDICTLAWLVDHHKSSGRTSENTNINLLVVKQVNTKIYPWLQISQDSPETSDQVHWRAAVFLHKISDCVSRSVVTAWISCAPSQCTVVTNIGSLSVFFPISMFSC